MSSPTETVIHLTAAPYSRQKGHKPPPSIAVRGAIPRKGEYIELVTRWLVVDVAWRQSWGVFHAYLTIEVVP